MVVVVGGGALWTFCSSDQPLRKHSVLSGAGTGRLLLERYQVFKNKGMCFPFAADLSAEVFLLRTCKCFHPGCWEGVSNFLSSISGRFPVCCGSLIVHGKKKKEKKKECAVEKTRGNCVSTYVLECESLMRKCVVGSLRREVILAYGVRAALRSVWGLSLQVSLPRRDMKTINLTADLTTAPQDECLTRSSLPGSKIADIDRDCI